MTPRSAAEKAMALQDRKKPQPAKARLAKPRPARARAAKPNQTAQATKAKGTKAKPAKAKVPPPVQVAFSENLVLLRLAKRLTQEDLAARAGLKQSHISALECGVMEPRLRTLIALADGLDISMNRLVPRSPGEVRRKQPDKS
jgi:ribosome-binding protein aMBF1 (putative translation factor)